MFAAVAALASSPQEDRTPVSPEPAAISEPAPSSKNQEAAHLTRLSYVTIGAGALALTLLLAGVHHFSKTGMQRWTVNSRLAAGFTAIIVVLAGLALESYFSLHEALSDFTEYRADARHSNLAGKIQTQYREMRIAAKDLVIFRTEEPAQRYTRHKEDLLHSLDEGKTAIHDPKLVQKIKEIETTVSKHAALCLELQKAIFAGKTDDAAEINKQMGATGTVIGIAAAAVETEFLAQQNHSGPRIAAALQYTQSAVIWLGIAAIVLGAGLAIIIARSITGPLRQLAESIGAGAEQTAAAAGQVSSASQSLAEGASEQAASLEETSASLEELSSMTKRNADSATSAKSLSGETRLAAEAGNADVTDMRQAMDAIKTSSNDIAKIIKSIDEIAFQTNILALNAAVEAARAGEAGAGFAVVAEEVRALAQRSANSAKETAAKIEVAIQNGEQGARVSTKVAQSLGVIVDKARKVDELVAEIATASSEQNQGIGQINTAVSQMDQVTQSNAGNAEETAAAAEELNAQSVTLKEAVSQLQALTGVNASHTSGSLAPLTTKKLHAAKRVGEQPKPAPTRAITSPDRGRGQQVLVNGKGHRSAGHDDFFKDE